MPEALTSAQVEEAYKLHEDGWSYKKLGLKFFVDSSTISKHIAKYKKDCSEKQPNKNIQ